MTSNANTHFKPETVFQYHTPQSRKSLSAKMSMSFEPSLSTSGMRPPLSSADAPSMADQLPSINFGFEDLRSRMAQFTAKFDSFIERGRKQVLEERNQFRVNLAELQGVFDHGLFKMRAIRKLLFINAILLSQYKNPGNRIHHLYPQRTVA